MEYKVQGGDTVKRIADRFEVSLEDLVNSNESLRESYRLESGQVVNIPAQKQQEEVLVEEKTEPITWVNLEERGEESE